VIPIWEKKRRIYFMDAFIYGESFGPSSVTIDIDAYEMNGATEVIFHNYLVEKEALHNTF
jgi:hypothetical protein